MSDHIEVDGKKYFEESYLILANNNSKRRDAKIADLDPNVMVIAEAVQRLCALLTIARAAGMEAAAVICDQRGLLACARAIRSAAKEPKP